MSTKLPIDTIVETLKKEERVLFAYLYGSAAAGEERPGVPESRPSILAEWAARISGAGSAARQEARHPGCVRGVLGAETVPELLLLEEHQDVDARKP